MNAVKTMEYPQSKILKQPVCLEERRASFGLIEAVTASTAFGVIPVTALALKVVSESPAMMAEVINLLSLGFLLIFTALTVIIRKNRLALEGRIHEVERTCSFMKRLFHS